MDLQQMQKTLKQSRNQLEICSLRDNFDQQIVLSSSGSFLQHYATNEEMTDIQTIQTKPLIQKEKAQTQNYVDYIDQFLWKNVAQEQDDLFGFSSIKTTTFMQEQNNVNELPVFEKQQQQDKVRKDEEQIDRIHCSSEDKYKDELSKDYRKNLAGYIVKKVLRIFLSPDYKRKLNFLCTKEGVDIQHFKAYCQKYLPKLFGPNSIYELLLMASQQERGMKKLLMKLLNNILRKKYTIQILKEGRMRDFDAYIKVKNQGLLYFANIMP